MDPTFPREPAGPPAEPTAAGVDGGSAGNPPTATLLEPARPVVRRAPRHGLASGTALLAVAALVAVGGVTFAIGRLTAPAAASARGGLQNGAFGNGANTGGGPGNGRQGAGGLFGVGGLTVRGRVSSVSASGISIMLATGQTVDIPTDSSTTYHSQAAASAADVRSGSTVLVQVSGAGAGGPGSAPAPSGSPGPRLGTARDVTVVGP